MTFCDAIATERPLRVYVHPTRRSANPANAAIVTLHQETALRGMDAAPLFAAWAEDEATEFVSSRIGVNSSTDTGATKRYPCRGTVSMKRGLSDSSSMAARSFFSMTFRLPSKSI